MAREIEKLKAINLGRMRSPGRHSDGAGLWLQISQGSTKSWLFQYSSPATGKVRQFGLGPLHSVSLAEARQFARDARNQVRNGIDPIDAKKERRNGARLAQAKLVTFKEASELYIARQKGAWKNPVHVAQWASTLETYANPIIGDLHVADIGKAQVLAVLEPIWNTKTETASRLRGRIERILNLAIVNEWRAGPNPAAWTGNLKEILASPKKLKNVRHHPALPYVEIPAFMAELRNRDGLSARALEFSILTAARTGETIGATWAEIDLAEKVWTIPASRMKAKRKHSVPLSDRAMAILAALPREEGNPSVFIGGREGAALSNMAMLELLRDMRPGLTVHGFRSTFRDWAAEETAFANHIVEMALAHSIGDRTEEAYRRGDLLKKRHRLMADWAKTCGRAPSQSSNNVTPIGRKRSAS